MLSRIGSIGSLSLSLSLSLASACGGGGGGGGPGPDAGLDAATDAPPAPFLTEVDCANPGPPGTGIAPGAALHKFTLDDDPLAVCNDGSFPLPMGRDHPTSVCLRNDKQVGGPCWEWPPRV